MSSSGICLLTTTEFDIHFLLYISALPHKLDKSWYSLTASTLLLLEFMLYIEQRNLFAASCSSDFFLFGMLLTNKQCRERCRVNSKYNSSEMEHFWVFILFQGSPQHSPFSSWLTNSCFFAFNAAKTLPTECCLTSYSISNISLDFFQCIL